MLVGGEGSVHRAHLGPTLLVAHCNVHLVHQVSTALPAVRPCLALGNAVLGRTLLEVLLVQHAFHAPAEGIPLMQAPLHALGLLQPATSPLEVAQDPSQHLPVMDACLDMLVEL